MPTPPISTTRPYSRTVIAAARVAELGARGGSRSSTTSIAPAAAATIARWSAPPEVRRVLVARLPGPTTPAITAVTRAIVVAGRSW